MDKNKKRNIIIISIVAVVMIGIIYALYSNYKRKQRELELEAAKQQGLTFSFSSGNIASWFG